MTCETDDRAGNAAVVVILLLLVAGAACWFVFKDNTEPELPPADGPVGTSHVDQGGMIGDSEVQMDGTTGMRAKDSSISGDSVPNGELPVMDNGAIDWKARQAQLKEQFRSEFREPKIGMNVKMKLASGRIVQGRITDLTDDYVTLRIVGTGKATYKRAQISPVSQVIIFKEVFADYSARKALADEKASLAGSSSLGERSE